MRSHPQHHRAPVANRDVLVGRTLHRRRIASGLLLMALLLVAPGCQLNRSFFQMDSNSRVPFFGVDLAPSWPKRESSVDGVSRLQSEATQRPQPQDSTKQPEPPSRPLSLPRSDSVVTSTSSEGVPVETFR